ncbi:MAG TPA: histidine phosphatase family protein [Rhodothermales bacterium]|nr:histidine phosphatase family protein [Rhodothermales bacterium]
MPRPDSSFRLSRAARVLPLVLLCACASSQRPAAVPVASTVYAPSVTTIFLVRHAERAPGQGDVPLSEVGRLRALALRDSLLRRGVSAIVVSQWRRTADTAQPLAEATGVPVTARPLDMFDVKGSARAVAMALAAEHAGRTVLVVGHSNTIPAMVSALTGTERADLNDGDYDGLYVVRITGGQATVTRLRYGADDGVPDPQ